MTEHNTTAEYYTKVGDYYDIFAQKHHKKSDDNPILTGMRESFRTYVTHPNPKNILDIGCGPGMDVAWAAQKYPDATVYGIDVSGKMTECAQELCTSLQLNNTKFINTGIENLQQQLPANTKFDVVYVFFGALNTVASLHDAAKIIDELLNTGGQAVLTFVNKYYLSEFFIHMAKLKPAKATARWGKVWRGYSNDYKLASKTYTPSDITNVFAATSLQLQHKRGYSIFYPAWFQQSWLQKFPQMCKVLSHMDDWANKTSLFWGNGEYTLFVYNKP